MVAPSKHRPCRLEVTRSHDLLALWLARQDQLRRHPLVVYAVDCLNQRLCPGHARWRNLLEWVNLVRTGQLFPQFGRRLKKTLSSKVSDRSLWREVCLFYLDLFDFYAAKFKLGHTDLPDLADCIFRDPKCFQAGAWGVDKDIWLILINRMPDNVKDELYESVHGGVDLLSYTERVSKSKSRPRGGKSRDKYYSVPVKSAEYVRRQLGRHPDKVEHANAYEKDGKVHPAGYRPVIDGEDEAMFESPNQRFDEEEIEIIYTLLAKWIEQGAITLTPLNDHQHGSRVVAGFDCDSQVFLPLILEKTKPRLCQHGGLLSVCAPADKLPMKLDDVRRVLELVKGGDYLTKIDDKSGFHHLLVGAESQCLVNSLFGDMVLTARGLTFGLSSSPYKFQLANSVVVTILNSLGCRTTLYLDDR